MFNMAVFKKIVAVAALAGILAGLLLTAVQRVQVVPLILQAEVYEQAAEAANASRDATVSAHEHHAEAWAPADGWERTLFTTGANIIVGLSFALLLAAAIAVFRKKTDWRIGLLWGAAAYAVFFVAPSLGLPPEVPGTEAAQLSDRQVWWLMTTAFTATGLALLVFARHWAAKIGGALLLGVPHLIGAPQPQVHSSLAPEELAHSFVIASAIANAVFWLALGGLLGFFYKKIG
ncbi:MAG: CbtA family protein [Gammaproteobacteria bacterium]|nr:CbtA family protein [Gammaproteobacteria bacterium]